MKANILNSIIQLQLFRYRLNSLTEIVRGDVYLDSNYFCYLNTIQWQDIFNVQSNATTHQSVQITRRNFSDCEFYLFHNNNSLFL